MTKTKAKETNAFEAFKERKDDVVRYVLENRKALYMASVAVLALILLAGGWMIYRTDYEKNAQKLYVQAFNYHHFAPPGAETAAQSIELYRKVTEKYPGSRSAAYAVFSTGNLLYKMNDIDGAINAYEVFLRQSGAKNEWRSMAFSGLGYCYEAKRQTERALEAYEQATKNAMSGAFLASIYTNMARLYVEKKESDKALSLYRKALEQKNEPLMNAMIKRKIAELEA